jgi:hypothetical protein
LWSKAKSFGNFSVSNQQVSAASSPGAICLTWPEKKEGPQYLVKVLESIVEDFETIQRVVPYTQKQKIDPNEVAAIENTKKALKTNVAKSIFENILAGRSQKTQDPNDG